MKKIIAIISIGIKLIALDFGKDVDIVGKWYIRSVDDLVFSFASGVGNKWVFNFKQDGSIYDISKEKEAKKQLNWKYDKEGIVHINFEFQTENKELSNFVFSNSFCIFSCCCLNFKKKKMNYKIFYSLAL